MRRLFRIMKVTQKPAIYERHPRNATRSHRVQPNSQRKYQLELSNRDSNGLQIAMTYADVDGFHSGFGSSSFGITMQLSSRQRAGSKGCDAS